MNLFENTACIGPRRGASLVLVSALIASAGFGSPREASQASAFPDLRFRSIGPAVMGGRVDDVEVVEGSPSTLYIGTASGGVWKSTNLGTTWTPIFDGEETSSIGDVAVAPSDPQNRLGGDGRGEQSTELELRFGRLQIGGRRKQIHAHRP